MNTRYYLGWFNDVFFEKLIKILQEDIVDRKSLVMISANMSHYDKEVVGATERSWLDHANITFDDYKLVDHRVEKEEAQNMVKNASVIFLLGGNVLEQNTLLKEYGLMNLIKESNALIMGTSAGSINMSAKWLYSEYTGLKDGETSIYSGINLDEFSVLSHYDLENNMEQIQNVFSPLLKESSFYASNKDCAIRVKGGVIDILGDVYKVSQTNIEKLAETLVETL